MFAVVYDVGQKFFPEYIWSPEMCTPLLYKFKTFAEAQRQCYYLNVLNEKAQEIWAALSDKDKTDIKVHLKDKNMSDQLLHHYFFADLFPRLVPLEKTYLVVSVSSKYKKSEGR